MSRKKKPLPLFEHVTIADVAAEGKALARVTIPEHDGTEARELVVFTEFCVPGDVVDLQITKKKHSYAEARVVRFHQLSPVRTTPPCPHFGICGGCKWQQLPYEAQLAAKQKQVADQLRRIGKVALPELRPIMGSVEQFKWLTHEQISSGEMIENMNALGFHITGAFDKILHIEKCCLMDDLHNRIRNAIYSYAVDNQLSFFDLRQQTGLLRDMMIRNSNSGEWMVLIQFHFATPGGEGLEKQQAEGLLNHLADEFPQISSLLWVDNQKRNNTFADLPINVYKGNDHIFELMENLRFKVGPKSFYQTNTLQAYRLYSVARDFAFGDGTAENSKPLVYDLYTGTGTIANFVSAHASKVIGIEYVADAIEDAKVNSEINGITNTQFFAGDMKDILTEEFINAHGRPDIIITDPPRAGMHPDVVDVIIKASPRKIVYVSCNPATQARDLQLLDSHYKVVAVQPVDMFPHTPHVENVVLLEHK